MALFISQKDDRTELQKQIAAELQRKARENSKIVDRPDGVKDSQYIKGTKATTNSAWIWLVVAVLIIVAIIWLTVVSRSR